jgi:hypothetical protein
MSESDQERLYRLVPILPKFLDLLAPCSLRTADWPTYTAAKRVMSAYIGMEAQASHLQYLVKEDREYVESAKAYEIMAQCVCDRLQL